MERIVRDVQLVNPLESTTAQIDHYIAGTCRWCTVVRHNRRHFRRTGNVVSPPVRRLASGDHYTHIGCVVGGSSTEARSVRVMLHHLCQSGHDVTVQFRVASTSSVDLQRRIHDVDLGELGRSRRVVRMK